MPRHERSERDHRDPQTDPKTGQPVDPKTGKPAEPTPAPEQTQPGPTYDNPSADEEYVPPEDAAKEEDGAV